jgi:serine/threonine protein kinase
MANSDSMITPYLTYLSKAVLDNFGNIHHLQEEIASGGQGSVFRTTDDDLAVKIINVESLQDFERKKQELDLIRVLPLPNNIPISLPLANLTGNKPGYILKLLNNMQGLGYYTNPEVPSDESSKTALPSWLKNSNANEKFSLHVVHYANTGSSRRRFKALSKCAAILARLHNQGLVFGDISPNNVFVTDDSHAEVWLIDSDNIRLETKRSGKVLFTRRFGAPEFVTTRSGMNSRTDIWAFSVMAFEILTLVPPFHGKWLLENDEGDWDSENSGSDDTLSANDKAEFGLIPFIDDEADASNRCCFPAMNREWVLSSQLRKFFQTTLGKGRKAPQRRVAMDYWALELCNAHDRSLDCHNCKMSFFPDSHENCPYCKETPAPYFELETSQGRFLFPNTQTVTNLPHRMFQPFNLQKFDDTEFRVILNDQEVTATKVRGEDAPPPDLKVKLIGRDR